MESLRMHTHTLAYAFGIPKYKHTCTDNNRHLYIHLPFGIAWHDRENEQLDLVAELVHYNVSNLNHEYALHFSQTSSLFSDSIFIECNKFHSAFTIYGKRCISTVLQKIKSRKVEKENITDFSYLNWTSRVFAGFLSVLNSVATSKVMEIEKKMCKIKSVISICFFVVAVNAAADCIPKRMHIT